MSLRHLTLLQIDDLHGYLAPHPELFDLDRAGDFYPGGGLAGIASVFRDGRHQTSGAVIALDNGDTCHGTLPAVATQGEALIAPMQALELDAMTLRWEFAYGLEGVRRLINRLPYPVLAPMSTTAARSSGCARSPSSNGRGCATP